MAAEKYEKFYYATATKMALRREEYWGLSRLLEPKFLIKNLIKRRLRSIQSLLMLELYIRFKGRSEKSFVFPVCMK